MGSALSLFPGQRNTQLDDFSQYVYNDKYGTWMPGGADPDKWADENLAAPPPPPKSSKPTSENDRPAAASGGKTPAKQPLQQDDGSSMSAPQTPLPGSNDGKPLPCAQQLTMMYATTHSHLLLPRRDARCPSYWWPILSEEQSQTHSCTLRRHFQHGIRRPAERPRTHAATASTAQGSACLQDFHSSEGGR